MNICEKDSNKNKIAISFWGCDIVFELT